MSELVVLLLLLGCTTATTAATSNRQSDAEELQMNYGFGDLHLVNLDSGNFTNRAILRIQEDRYNPGSYFLMYLGFILKYKPGEPTSLFLGNPNQFAFKSYVRGNSSVAEFSAVTDIVQYNRTKYALSDYLNNCVREYDSDTDTITPLIGDCNGTSRTSVGFLNPGVKVEGDSHFLNGVLDIELVEPGNYFILCDEEYEQITTYDVVTGQAELLLKEGDEFSLPGPTSLLLNSDSTYLYVSHSNGLSKVNLDTREVNLLVGKPNPSIDTHKFVPFITGPFSGSIIGPMNSLAWVVQDKVLIGASDKNQALITMDLMEEKVFGSCVGDDKFRTTQTGSQETCRLSNPKSATIVNHQIYVVADTVEHQIYVVADTAEHLGNSSANSIFNIKLYEQPCSTCPVQISLASLEEVSLDYGSFYPAIIDFIIEDRYTPGQFYYNYKCSVHRLTPARKVEHFLGKDCDDQSSYSPGNSTTAIFSWVLDLVQYNQTLILLADFSNNCVRVYDSGTDYVHQFIGSCTLYEQVILEDGEVISADDNFLSGVRQITLLEKHNSLLIIDSSERIFQYHFSTHTVQLFGRNRSVSLDKPRGMLVNSDETELYVTEQFKYLTRVNLDTFDVTLLIGQRENPFAEGTLSSGEVDYVPVLSWMVQDKLIVGVQIDKEALVFVDLEGGQVYSVCPNLQNRTETLIGDLSACELNDPSSFMVASDGSIYIATILGAYNYYEAQGDEKSALYQIETKASTCKFQAPTASEIAEPDNTIFTQYQYLTVRCPAGMALNSTSNRRQCVDNSKWNEKLPYCVEITVANVITDLSPNVGQISGGTLVTVSGLIPDFGVEVYLNHSYGLIPLEVTIIPQRLSFHMPESTIGPAELIIKLTENVTKIYTFTYKEDPVLNYTIRSATIVSGGFEVIFSVSNINSSDNYFITIPSISKSCNCSKGHNMVICDVKNFTADGTGPTPRHIPIQLLSDGIILEHSDNLSLTVYADPVSKRYTISPTTSQELVLIGDNFDVGPLRQYYKINIVLKSGAVTECNIIEVENLTIKCTMKGGNNSESDEILLYLGNLQINASNVEIFPPAPVMSTEVARHGKPNITIGLASAVSIIIVISVILIAIICYRRRLKSVKQRESIRLQSSLLTKDDNDWYLQINVDLKAKLDPLLIKSDLLKLKQGSPIGAGNFGVIHLGQLYQDDVVKTVAVKTIKEANSSIPLIEKFLEEAVILQDFSHANVLQTLGVCIPESDKPQIILPFMANGDLKSLLQVEHMKFTFGDLMHLAKQIACGMEYLSSHRFVHRDLAARNCLVGDDYIVKIADFGLSKDLYSGDYYKSDEMSKVALPVRWLSLESLKTGKFTTESDMWSFGVLMWELCTRGAQPYADLASWDVKPYLEYGRRLQTPTYCAPFVWEVMYNCWLEEPDKRPTFTMIHDFLSVLLEDTEFHPHGSYSYVREYTKHIPNDYHVQQVDKVQEVAGGYVNLSKSKSDIRLEEKSEVTIDIYT